MAMSLKNPVTLFRLRLSDEYLASRETLPAMVERVVEAPPGARLD
jgi:hypothetical protein